MKLTNTNRIMLINILPQEGKYEDIICIKDIKKKIDPTQDDLMKWNFKTIGNQIHWTPENEEYNIEFTELEKEIIKATLKKINSEAKLNENTATLYKMFVL